MVSQLWVEKYRPSCLEEYVFIDETHKQQVENWIKEKSIPHLLFAGPAGTGKTSLARMLTKELGVDSNDILELNASLHRGIGEVRDKIKTFCQTWPFGEFRVVLLDEAEQITPDAQASLKNEIEQYSDQVRFILTSNHPEKIISPLHSRMQTFIIDKMDKDSFMTKIIDILLAEGVDFTPELVDDYTRMAYPDLRKCINLIQQHVVNDVLEPPSASSNSVDDIMLKFVNLVKNGKIAEARQILSTNISESDFEHMFRFLYENLELWGDTLEQQNQAILIIAKGLRNHSFVADKEINFSATMVELQMSKDGSL